MFNPDNTLAHKEGTGKEILEQLNMKVDAFVASVGSGGTLLGVAEALREASVNAKVVGVEPQDSKVLEEWAVTGFLNSFLEKLGVPRRKYIIEEMLEKELPDEIMHIGHEDARNMANRLCQEEGIFCGISSGANVYAALKVAKKLGKGANVVTVCVDRRDRYLYRSTQTKPMLYSCKCSSEIPSMPSSLLASAIRVQEPPKFFSNL